MDVLNSRMETTEPKHPKQELVTIEAMEEWHLYGNYGERELAFAAATLALREVTGGVLPQRVVERLKGVR